MKLKIFRFGNDRCDWVCHESKEKAISFYVSMCGGDCYKDLLEFWGDEAVTEEPMDKAFTFYPDEETPDKDTFDNLIKKYCDKPDFFAHSEL
ncbi:hypothetical protein [Virgibacillus sp. Bac332]|uniref:hypothetical protein n=1 Tax=Virgibacillus sp. Bac332 TaxID=2419842 RepID=UPI000EF4F8E9|nr:hypothetical protein [Virgibacillus sp. Bac332]